MRRPENYEWTPEQVSLLGTIPDSHLAERWGMLPNTVAKARIARGSAAFQFQRRWTQEEREMLATYSDSQACKLLGRSLGSVQAERRALGIKKVGSAAHPHLEEIRTAYTTTSMTVQEIAEKYGVNPQYVRKRAHGRKWQRPDNPAMKTSGLSGATLDTWVAKAISKPPGAAYSSSWEAGGPLIEKERIHVAPMPGKGWVWCAVVVSESTKGAWQEGRTPLIAAMRALVASRYGNDLPD